VRALIKKGLFSTQFNQKSFKDLEISALWSFHVCSEKSRKKQIKKDRGNARAFFYK
jgi:hypothetical protein